MSVNINTTTKKYHGAMAANYETKRKKQERWDIENRTVQRLLSALKPKSVVDIPCGTGRFIPLYYDLGVRSVLAIDVSNTMIDIAKEKMKKLQKSSTTDIVFKVKDVRELKLSHYDVAVCIRFLDLIDQDAMRDVMKKLFMTAEKAIICTIRFGPVYRPKSNTAEHDEQKFRAMVSKHGWKIQKAIPVFNQGWHILQIVPK